MSGLLDGMANGLSRPESLEKDAQVWERAWTLEEIRQASANWSLAADSGLFLFLQDFSQRMLSKTHNIEKQLDSLIRDTKATDSCLHSVFNDFLMLSNTQFIENRVYDEEVEEPLPKADALDKQPEQEKTREQKEAELIPKIQEAVTYGLRVLESAFEHLDIKAGNSDSEDEEVTDRVEAILEPKDLYVDRPLPCLIGSQAFMEQEDVGLGDLSSDEMLVDSDRDSVIESEDGKEAAPSDEEDFNQEEGEDRDNIKKRSSVLSYGDDEEEDEDSDIFGDSDRDDDDDDDDTKNTGPSSFADELAARIRSEPVSKAEGDRTSLTSKKKRKEPKPAKPPAEDDSDDMFKPPKMDEDKFSPFGGKSGLFSGGKGLFDDDDEGDLFSEASKPAVSEEKKASHESTEGVAQSAESGKPGRKVPSGAVAVFPDNGLFTSRNDSDSLESKENGAEIPRTHAASQHVPAGGGGGGGGGLFDDDEEDDDFFGSKGLKKSSSAGQEKPKPKKALDLFDEDDEDGDIFNEKYSATTVAQKEVVEEQNKPPAKKMPAGAVSMFGPGTTSLLTEGLKKRQPSTSEDSEKSEENGLAPDVGKTTTNQTQKAQSRGLFSDDEDAQIFPSIPKSQSKPEPTSQGKISKAPVSLFDDEEEEDLFASAAKSKPNLNQAKASTPQPSKTASSSLFSDDEDQWLSSKTTAGKPETKTGGMKASASAPSALPSATSPRKSSLFDKEDDDDDLFAPTKVSSQKKSQRVALLFEDEDDDDEDKGSLFGIKPAVSTNTAAPAAKTAAVASQPPSLLHAEQSEEDAVCSRAGEDKSSEQKKEAVKSGDELQLPPSAPESSESKKKPAGAVSLFGGIDVLASKHSKSPQEESDNFLSADSPPPKVKKEEKKEEKVKVNTVSLFDDDEEDESSWNDSLFTPNKPADRNTLKPTEERSRTKSTGVFQDEELLFSQTQQKDNDPDVDLFAASAKPAASQNAKLSSVKPAATSLFTDDDEDDLFSPIKPQALPPKVAEKPSKPPDKAPVKAAASDSAAETQKPAPSPVKPKDPSSRIGKLQASLVFNPNALLPGAVPILPGAVSVLPGLTPSSSSGVSSSSLSPSPVSTPVGAYSEGGVSFDTPVHVSILQSANKTRAKGSAHRRPQSRAARQQAVQSSLEDKDLPLTPEHTLTSSVTTTALPSSSSSLPSVAEISPRPSILTLPVSTDIRKDSSKENSKTLPPSSDEDDLFGSDGLFGASVTKRSTHTAQRGTKSVQRQAGSNTATKKVKDSSTLPSIFDDHGDDLFQKVKPKSITKTAKTSSFLEHENDEDIFGVSNSSTPTPTSTASKDVQSSSTFSKQDIFQDKVATVPKAHKKHKEKPVDPSLFDDNIDIFADLTDSLKPKQKSKKKGETKSIFDDDMDDIFSPSPVKPVTKAPQKAKKTPPSQENSTSVDSADIFDDPLNALDGVISG
ncbi:hypothetical protein LDENG_00132330 [Lucifuga dentata]|nr:hypothetical protein LDENG_00132330 [Lucifuga dentata]